MERSRKRRKSRSQDRHQSSEVSSESKKRKIADITPKSIPQTPAMSQTTTSNDPFVELKQLKEELAQMKKVYLLYYILNA